MHRSRMHTSFSHLGKVSRDYRLSCSFRCEQQQCEFNEERDRWSYMSLRFHFVNRTGLPVTQDVSVPSSSSSSSRSSCWKTQVLTIRRGKHNKKTMNYSPGKSSRKGGGGIALLRLSTSYRLTETIYLDRGDSSVCSTVVSPIGSIHCLLLICRSMNLFACATNFVVSVRMRV